MATMVAVFREVKRVLRDDGFLWVNLGDSYNSNQAQAGIASDGYRGSYTPTLNKPYQHHVTVKGVVPGNQLLIPHRVALALQSDGWVLRDTVIWAKKSPMPSSQNGVRWTRCRVKVNGHQRDVGWSNSTEGRPQSDSRHTGPYDGAKWEPCPGCPKCIQNGGYVLRRGQGRTTTAHEYLFLFTKGNDYFMDMENWRESATSSGGGACVGKRGGTRVEKTEAENAAIRSGMRIPRSVWTLSSEPTKYAHFACVDQETECLTADGWKPYSGLRVGELAAQFDMETQTLSWGEIEGIATYDVVDQEMVVGKGRDFDFWLTPNHRCVVYRRQKTANPPVIVEASDLRNSHQIPITAPWDDYGSGPGLDWAELIGWYISEGHEKKNGLGVEIYQSKSDNPDFCVRIQSLLDSVGAEYESATYKRKYRGRDTKQMAFHVHGFAAAKLRMLCPNKVMPNGCLSWSNAQCHALLAGLCMGDGSARAGGRITFVQKRDDIANMVHALAIRCGLSATIRKENGLHRLYFAQRTTRSFRGTNGGGDGLERRPYTGVVWCPKLPKGTWVARRNGRVFITGNTYPSELVRRCLLPLSPRGCCPACGAQWAPIVDSERIPTRPALNNKIWKHTDGDRVGQRSNDSPNLDPERHIVTTNVIGYRPTCSCNAGDPVPCRTIDIFSGTGTTGQTACFLGHDYTGIELNERYAAHAEEWINQEPRWSIRQKTKAAKKTVKSSTSQTLLF